MVKMYTAFTNEIDDADAAAKEIYEQLAPEKNMLKNTVGIAVFYSEYADNGIYGEVSAALPFDVVGVSSSFTGAKGECGASSFAIAMLTSDDVFFETAVMETENKRREAITEELSGIYNKFLEKEPPALVLSYMAAHANFSGDDLIDFTNDFPGEILLFGSLAWNTDGVSTINQVTFNQTASPHLLSLVAIYGDVRPRFQVTTSLDFNSMVKEAVPVTDASGPVLKSVGGVPALDYLRGIGVVRMNDKVEQLFAVPAVVFYENGTQAARALLERVKDGSADVLAAGNIPVGAKVSFAFIDTQGTVKSVTGLTEDFEKEKVRNSLNYSCVARSWTLGSKYFAELEIYADYYKRSLGGAPANYIFGYSGGEICPVPDKDGKLINCFHNYSLISCVLE